MIVAFLSLTVIGTLAILYSRWKAAQAIKADVAIKQEEAKVTALKQAIEQTQKEVENAGKDYNTVYDAYVRKYGKVPRDDSK